jgi:hypothetical protein
MLYKFPGSQPHGAMWPDPNSFRRYMDDLLVDKRGNRQGFPVECCGNCSSCAPITTSCTHLSRPWESLNRSG